MTASVKNFWLSRAEQKRCLVDGGKKQDFVPSIYSVSEWSFANEIESICNQADIIWGKAGEWASYKSYLCLRSETEDVAYFQDKLLNPLQFPNV